MVEQLDVAIALGQQIVRNLSDRSRQWVASKRARKRRCAATRFISGRAAV